MQLLSVAASCHMWWCADSCSVMMVVGELLLSVAADVDDGRIVEAELLIGEPASSVDDEDMLQVVVLTESLLAALLCMDDEDNAMEDDDVDDTAPDGSW